MLFNAIQHIYVLYLKHIHYYTGQKLYTYEYLLEGKSTYRGEGLTAWMGGRDLCFIFS